MRRDLGFLFTIAIISIFVSLPLINKGFYTVHDDQQIARLFLFDEAQKAGQFPPRWVRGLGFGFGYPLFVFYPPLVYMFGESFHLLGIGYINSIKIVFFASFLLSGFFMYLAAREFFGKIPAQVASLFYILVPYRALDVYVRGALAEAFSFVWLPAILWSFYKLKGKDAPKYVVTSAIFLGLLMITHNLIFLPFTILLAFYLLFLILKSNDKKTLIKNFATSVFLAFGISAFFWIPALLEKKYTLVDQILLSNLANYRIHFVDFKQLWNWPWGFGGSAEGLADGISFKIGKIHVMSAVFALIFAVFFKQSINKLQKDFVILFFFLFAFSAFMTTSYSRLIWTLIPQLAYLQFPWRFLTFTSLFASFLAGGLIYFLKLPILRLTVSTIFIIILLSTNLKLFKPQSYRLNLTDENATSKEVINWDISKSSFEYIPKGIQLKRSELGTSIPIIEKNQIPKTKVEVLQGNTLITNVFEKPQAVTFLAESKTASLVKINTFNFPGWQAKIDGKNVVIDENNPLKLIVINLESGIHDVEVRFKNTAVIYLANLITFFSIMIIIFLTIKSWRTKKLS